MCRKLDGKRFKVSEQQPGLNCPPMHPWCRSTTICDISDGELSQMKRRARNPVTGKNETVPANMTYEQWYDKNVRGRPDAEKKERMLHNLSSDKRQYGKYRGILGDTAPETFDKFQELKYNDIDGFDSLKQRVANQKKTGIFLEKLNAGGINTNVKRVKQQEHVRGTKAWIKRVKDSINQEKTLPSMFNGTESVEGLVQKYKGTGTIDFKKNQDYPVEYVTADHVVGRSFNVGTGKYEETRRFAIRYSSKGVHLHPVKEV